MNKKTPNKNKFVCFLSIFCLILAFGCQVSYSLLSPATIPSDAKTFTVYPFTSNADKAPSNFRELLTNELINIIQRQTRLTYVPEGGDLVFEGKIVGYTIDISGVQANSSTAQNVITYNVKLKYTNKFDEKKNVDTEIKHQEYYDQGVSQSAVENTLNQQAAQQFAIRFFDAAFGDW